MRLSVTAGRLSKASEVFELAELGEDTHLNAAGDLYVDAGIAASDVICCCVSACTRTPAATMKPSPS